MNSTVYKWEYIGTASHCTAPGIDVEGVVAAGMLEVVYERREQTREQLEIVQPVLRAYHIASHQFTTSQQLTARSMYGKCTVCKVQYIYEDVCACASSHRAVPYHELGLHEQVVRGVHHVGRVVDVVVRVGVLRVARLHLPEERLELRQRDLRARTAQCKVQSHRE